MVTAITHRWFSRWMHSLKLSVFPSKCKGCGSFLVFKDEDIVCNECKKKITLTADPTCRVCGKIVGNRYDICGQCIIQLPPFRRHLSYSRYWDLLKELILLYKYGGIERLKYLFAGCYMEMFYERVREPFDYVVPVPPDRSRKREFGPILEIAKILSEKLGFRLLSDYLIKAKKTPPQASLTKAKRMKNLDGAFKLNHSRGIRLEGKKILLIDDVYTTGTTVNQCTQLLVKEKADVVVLTLARS